MNTSYQQLSIQLLEAIAKLVFNDGYVKALVNNSMYFIFKPSRALQPLMLVFTGNYGVGSELVAQKIFYVLASNSSVIADIGAHYGFYTLLAAIHNPTSILSFEPSKENYRILLINISINKLFNVKAYRLALADYNGWAILGIPPGGRSGENTMAIGRAISAERVNVNRFDYIARKEGIRSVDIVKIDVEGAEYKVLKGFGKYLRTARFILIEVHPEQMKILGGDAERLYNYLIELNYEIYCISSSRPHIYPFNYVCSKRKICSRNRHHVLAINTEYYSSTRKLIKWLKTSINTCPINIELFSYRANTLMNLYKVFTRFKRILSAINRTSQYDDLT